MDEALKAVADPTRRAILRLVRDGEQPAGEIAAHFPHMSRPAVSQHLRVLTDAGLLEVRPDGNRRLYRWRREGLRDAASFVEEMWSEQPRPTQGCGGTRGMARARPCRERGEEGEEVSEPDHDGVVEQTLRIAARPQTVWRYWTEPDRMRDWWAAEAEVDPRPGGICWVDLAEGGTIRGEYVELVPYERIAFTFGWEESRVTDEIPPGSTLVEVTFVEDGGDTLMTLRHSGLPRTVVDLHHAGWAHHLPMLVAAVKES